MWHIFSGERELKAHLASQMCCIDERDRVQKKTFTKWVNKHLMKVRKHINDLYEDLRDGHNLISLLEVLSGVKLPKEPAGQKSLRLVRGPSWCRTSSEDCEEEEEEDGDGPREKGRMRFHRLQNVQIALDFLKQRQGRLCETTAPSHPRERIVRSAGGFEMNLRHFGKVPAEFTRPEANA
ncbi:UNVERIFIED_CONTAM: Microtubule-actin cross-linking factor 1, isoforms 1/2/3/5 [Gekko kuhli]